jgi:hypothetical protein
MYYYRWEILSHLQESHSQEEQLCCPTSLSQRPAMACPLPLQRRAAAFAPPQTHGSMAQVTGDRRWGEAAAHGVDVAIAEVLKSRLLLRAENLSFAINSTCARCAARQRNRLAGAGSAHII